MRAMILGLFLLTAFAGSALAEGPLHVVITPDQTCVYDDLPAGAGSGTFCTATACTTPPHPTCV